jgi:hypothetical protein
MLNAYATGDPSSEATNLHLKVKNMNLSASQKQVIEIY